MNIQIKIIDPTYEGSQEEAIDRITQKYQVSESDREMFLVERLDISPAQKRQIVSAEGFKIPSPINVNVTRSGYQEYIATHDIPRVQSSINELYSDGTSVSDAVYKLFGLMQGYRSDLNQSSDSENSPNVNKMKKHLNDIIKDI